ncbi:MAG: hypothetical protein AAF533_16710 [Acidobacteriota bacterium]
MTFVRPLAAAAFAALLCCTVPGAVLASPIPVSGVLTEGCAQPWNSDASLGTLVAFKVGNLEQPDVLVDDSAVGGQAIGGANIQDVTYLLPPNWRSETMDGERVVVFALAEGLAVLDSDQLGGAIGNFGASAVQVVGALNGDAPQIEPRRHGYVVEFAPLRELTAVGNPAEDCALAGHPDGGLRLIAGYNVYRLPQDEFPDPSLEDFRLHGFLDHLALDRVAWTLVDTGEGPGDLVSADEFWIRNPDGLPDSGDEVIVYRDTTLDPVGRVRENAPDPSRAYWYRIQPVVSGSLAYFADGEVGNSLQPTRTLDLDGDGTQEAVDLQRDGQPDFIDPSLNGLGLAWSGEILSSPVAGSAEPLPPLRDSDEDGLPDDYEADHGLDPFVSNVDMDTDGDGLSDQLEEELGTHPDRGDSDLSGEDDAREILYGRNPRNPHDDIVLDPAHRLGDIAPAGSRDGRLDVGDVVRLLRMAVGTDDADDYDILLGDLAPAHAPDPDSTLRERQGDGRIDIGDVVMALREAVGLVQVVEAGELP